MELDHKLNLKKIASLPNIANELSEKDLGKIGMFCNQGLEVDLQSRSEWEKRTERSLKLALQVVEDKSFPWPNASNVKFPLVTIAALQYHARAYPTLISSDTPVKCRVFGKDKLGDKKARAKRIESHMSYQILEQDQAWDSEMDKVLITQPIVGCAFKKTYFDPIEKIVISENILARDLVVNYWTKSLDTAQRISHILYYTPNDIYERVARGLWRDIDMSRPNLPVQPRLSISSDKAQGVTRPEATDETTPFEIVEQHVNLDLDGDGYSEPYIVTFVRDTKEVLRITARYNLASMEYNEKKDKLLRIKGETYFTKYPFVPSPDGGFYDLGFGVLLGPLNESINTILNQLVDAGTMANTAGGFLSRGIKVRGGNYNFAPLEWKHVDTSGDDLRKGIVPLPVREPSQVLFTLLNLLINYGERIGMSVDILTGQNPGQNTPAETSRTMVEQGMKIFGGIFKRTYRALTYEFRKIYRLNQLYLADEVQFVVSDEDGEGIVFAKDYLGPSSDVRPTADPNIVSDSQRIMQAEAMRNAAKEAPLYNRYQVELRYLEALKVPNIEEVLPDPKGPNAVPPPVNPKVQIEQIKVQAQQASDQLEMKLGLLKLLGDAELNQAKIEKLHAEAESLQREGNHNEHAARLNEINTMIALARERREATLGSVETMMKVFQSIKPPDSPPSPVTAPPAPQPGDPV
jgi:chaperonin GroES